MKGKHQKVMEQKETRNWAQYDTICQCSFKRPNAIVSHFKDYHANDGFICENCKMGVALAHASNHGVGVCERVSTIKKNKETKLEKKKKKQLAMEVRGYVSE